MKITVNATIEMELTVEEVMAVCQNSAAKKKVTEEVKTQVEQSFKSAGLESLNTTLKGLEQDKDYMTHLTWERMCTHKDQLWKLHENNVIDAGEWNKRTALIMDSWHGHETTLDDQTEEKFEHLMGDDEIE